MPLVFAIGQGVIDTTIPPPTFLHVDSGEDGGVKEHGRLSAVAFMGEEDTNSGALDARARGIEHVFPHVSSLFCRFLCGYLEYLIVL